MSGLDRVVREFESGDLNPFEQTRKFAREFPPELAKVRRQAGMQPVAINGSRSGGLKAGYFQIRLRDGTIGYFQRRTDDCVQAVIASLLQMPPHLVPDLHLDELLAAGRDPEEIDRMIDEQFSRWTGQHGLTIVFHATSPTWAKRWIGMVTTGDPFSDHTMLMGGHDCLFDPAHLLAPRDPGSIALENYTPADIDYGITIERR
jgi:hypothetical protein